MPLVDLHHVAIRTSDVAASERFYTQVLGMHKVERPEFDFPGAWLQMGQTMFHLMGGYAALDEHGQPCSGGAAVDHLALNARDFDAMKAQVVAAGLVPAENAISAFGIWQLFVRDPDGVLIELNFRVADEPEGANGPASARLGRIEV